MYRFGILGLLLASLANRSISKRRNCSRVCIFFLCTGPENSPVHILGLRYDHPTIEIDLENASGVPVDGIGIFAVAIAPGGCAAEPRKTIFAADPQVRPVRIGPRGFGEASGGDSMPHTGALVFFAKDLKVAYWHVQVGIAEVDFSDGTNGGCRHSYAQPCLMLR